MSDDESMADGPPSGRQGTDEVFNTASHLAGAIFGLVTLVLLVVHASVEGKPWHIVGFAIYGTTLLALFLASTLHHGTSFSAAVHPTLQTVDYCCIFLLIAGSYTPFCLVILRGALGWSVLGITWGLALVGVVARAAWPRIPKWATNTVFICMGWLGLVLAPPLLRALGWPAFLGVVAGGVFYTVGAFIFYLEKPNPVPGRFGFHEIWHVCVLLGAGCHSLVMFTHVLPYS